MSANSFATLAKTGPNPWKTTHTDGSDTEYTCHMAVIHWMFMELGDSGAVAHERLTAIVHKQCGGCGNDQLPHLSISANWYGTKFAGAGTTLIGSRAALFGGVSVGDVVLVGHKSNPSHSMVVVQKGGAFDRQAVFIRGFNNTGTFGKGPRLAYDNTDRDIHAGALWHTQGAETRFGQAFSAGGWMYLVPYATYYAQAQAVRAAFAGVPGSLTYNG